jgi:hypothetical protein
MGHVINKLRIEPAEGTNPRATCRVVFTPTVDNADLQRDLSITFSLDSNGLEVLGYDALERAAEQLEKRSPDDGLRPHERARKIRAFLEDIQRT